MDTLPLIVRAPWGVAAMVCALLAGPAALAGQGADAGAVAIPSIDPSEASDPMAPEMEGVTVEPHLGQTVPLDLRFVDENGRNVTLGDYTSGRKPILLTINYYRCPMLCGLVLNGVAAAIDKVPLELGEDYRIVTVSIDPAETASLARMKKDSYIKKFAASAGDGGPGPDSIEAGWSFLTGEQQNIAALTRAVGFGYKWVESAEQYAHPAMLVVLSPQGKITRYLYGIEYDPETLNWSLVEASDGKIGTTVDRFLLTCFHFDPNTGRYSLMAMSVMRWAGALTVILIVGTIGWLLIRERRRRNGPAPALE